MTEEDSKYLAEKMGYHKWQPEFNWANGMTGKCAICGKDYQIIHERIDFSSEHGFFLVFEWAKKEEWFNDFVYKIHDDQLYYGDKVDQYLVIPIYLIGHRFAEEVVAFLKEKK
jgi:hypothetical protein